MVKQVVNDNGGSATVTDFGLTSSAGTLASRRKRARDSGRRDPPAVGAPALGYDGRPRPLTVRQTPSHAIEAPISIVSRS